MADFLQDGRVATFHDLGHRSVEALEFDLRQWVPNRPLVLVIPCLASELERAAISNIIDELADVPYLDQVIVGLDQADEGQYDEAKKRFGELPQDHTVLWVDSPEIQALEAELEAAGLHTAVPGKGRNMWWSLGAVLATGHRGVVALHDADIVNYSRRMLARLVYPVMHPSLGYSFAKGYYYRASDGRLQGRATRLLVWPLVRALTTLVGPHDHLDLLAGFRYPLAGEVAFRTSIIDDLTVASDWAVELGMLWEAERLYRRDQICQIEIADVYDHKHQAVSSDDRSLGLHRMAIDITQAFLHRLAAEGEVLSAEHLRTLRAAYGRIADELVDRYHDDAVVNGFVYDRAGEKAIVEVFGRAIGEAGADFLADCTPDARLPTWGHVRDSLPSVLDRLRSIAAIRGSDQPV